MKIRQLAALGLALFMAGSLAVLHSSAAEESVTVSAVQGDVNADGAVTVADAVLMQKWLLGVPDASLAGADAADLNADGCADVFDLGLLKRKLLTAGASPRLVWSDEFDGDALDRTKWGYELGNWKLDADGNYVTNGWGNNEQEFYTDSNAMVKDGVLTIAARKEHYTDPVQGEYEYTSARLSTQHLFSTCGGRIEVRARCDAGKSLWPAIWMLPEDSVYGGWAASGEIDIMEGWGSTPEKICGTIHFGDVWPNNTYLTNNYEFPAGESSADWHTYAVEWESGEIRWYVDDVLYSTQTDWDSVGHAYPAPFDQNFYLILNLAVGGHFDGLDGVHGDPATFADGEKKFQIDYVRVYDLGGHFAPTPVTSLPLELYFEQSEAVLENKDGETVIRITNPGPKPYSVMGLIRGKQVHAGEKHTLSFDVSGSQAREMLVTVEDGAYNRYLDERVNVTGEDTHYSFDVTFSEDMSADLKFQLGTLTDAAELPAHTVTLRNIRWQ